MNYSYSGNSNLDALSRYFKYTPLKYTIRKEHLSIVKEFLKILKGYGFKRDGEDYRFKEWGVSISNNSLYLYQRPDKEPEEREIDSEGGLKVNVTLYTHLQKAAYDLSFYDKKDSAGNYDSQCTEKLTNIFNQLDISIQEELKWEIRQHRIGKLLKENE